MPLEIKVHSGNAFQQPCDVLALLVTTGSFDKQKALAELDRLLDGALLSLLSDADFSGRAEQVFELSTLRRLPAERIVLVGVGPKRSLAPSVLRDGAANAARTAQSRQSLVLLGPDKAGPAEVRALAEGIELGAYRFSRYFTGERVPKRSLGDARIFVQRASPALAKAAALGQGVARAVGVARDAVNEPPNELTPEALAQAARRVAKDGKLKITVLDEKGLLRAGMKLHAAVGQGSAHPPRFIHMSYAPKRAKKTYAFVGKGLTFDSGGLCIKPAAGMGDMKTDMGGAGAVLGLMAAVGAVRPDVAVHGIIGAAENMPDGNAYRPADVIGSLDGKTVEIINTDAEGRLVLADALAYARKLEPDVIVDAATLTGACLVALGKSCSAFYTADDALARRFGRAAKAAGESFWRMPLLEELREQLNSEIADLKHTGDRWGGSITAALFLREFVGDVPWIHCDVPGAVFADRPRGMYPKGATGHPVLTFLEFVTGGGR